MRVVYQVKGEGTKWLRARRGEWLPAGCSNSYCNRIAGFPPEETRCGVSPEVELLSPNFR